MKFVIALLLVVASVQANSSLHRYGWAAGKESVYHFQSQVLSGVPEISKTLKSGLQLTSQVRVQSYSDYSLRIKLENVEFTTLNGEVKLTESGRLQGRSGSEGGHIPEEFKQYLEQPFLAHIKGGVVTSFLVASGEPSGVTNIKRSVLAQLQLDVAGTQRSQIESNHIQLPTPEESELSGLSGQTELSSMSYFSTQEESIHGKCRTSYNINKLPQYKVNELEEKWSKEEQQLKGGLQGQWSQSSTESLEQSRTEQGKRHCEGKPHYQITKTRDLDHCEISPVFQKWSGFTGKCNLAKPSTCAGIFTTLSTSTIVVCGELSQFQIRKIQTENIIKANPLGYSTDESFQTTTQMNLELIKTKSITERLPIPSSTTEKTSLIYSYPEQSEVQGHISEETLKKSLEILGVRPLLPQPGLTESPKSLLPISIPKDQIKNQVLEQLKKMASEVSQSPESCSSKSDIAGTMASVAKYLRHLSLSQLEQLEREIKQESRMQQQGQQGQVEGQQGQKLMPLEKLFWDTISSVGTNPSTMLVIKKVKEGSLPTGKTEKMIQHTIRNVRYPTKELLRELVQMAKHETVKSNRTVLTAIIGNLADLFYRAYVNPTTMINNFPSQLYGVFGDKESQVLTQEFIPYLISLAEGQESGVGSESSKQQLQYSAIASLGRTGHLKAAKTLLKAAEGKIEQIESRQQSQQTEGQKEAKILRPLSVHSLKRIAKMNPTHIKPLLMAIIENPVESPEVRTAAVAILPFSKPTSSDIQSLVTRTWFEPSRQVASFIRTTLISLVDTQVPEFKTISTYVRAALPSLKNQDYGFLFSRNMHFNKFVQYLQTGTVSELQVQKSKRSMVPLRMAGSTKYYGHNEGSFQVGGLSWETYMQGMDQLVEKYVKYFTYAGKTSENTRQQLEKIAEKLGLQTRGFQPTQFFSANSFMGIQFDHFLDSEIVMETLSKLSRESEQGEKSISFNTVGGSIWQEATGLGMTEAGIPCINSVSFPVVYSAKGHLKVIPQSGYQSGMSLPQVEASITPVFNVKGQSSLAIISPFTKEIIGTGVEASVHSSLPIAIKAKITEGELDITIKNPTETERNGRETETLHGFVLPYTFKKSVMTVKPTSKSSSLKKIISGKQRMIEIPIGKSLGLSGKLIAESNNVYVDLSSYIEKIRQTSVSSLMSVVAMPSSIRMSSTKVKYNPSQSETKEFHLKLKLSSQSQGSSSLSSSIRNEDVESGFKSVKSVLEQVKSSQHGQATLLSLTASSKGQYSTKSLKSSLIVGKTTEQNGKITKTYAALNYVQSGSEVYGIKYEGKAILSQPMTRWNLDQLIQEELSGEFTAQVQYGKTSQQEQQIQISGKMHKSNEQKESVKESPEYKKCQREMSEGRKLSQVCSEVRLEAAALDKFEVQVERFPSSIAKSSIVTLVKELIESSLLGQISYLPESGSTTGLKINGKVDRTGHVAQVQVHTQSGEIMIQNLRLYGYLKNLLPLSVHNSVGSTLTQKLSQNRVPVTCAVEPRTITTFDNTTYNYKINDCEHLLLQDGAKYFPIAVLSKTLEESKKEVRIISGESEVKVTPQGENLIVKVNGQEYTLRSGEVKKIVSREGSFVEVVMKKYQDNTIYLNFPQQSLSIVTDGKRIEVVGSGLLWSRAVGLCGDMNGESSADLKSPKKCVMTPQIAAVSYILNKSGSSSSNISPRCEGIPSQYRQKYEQQSQQCLKERVIPTPLTTIYKQIESITLSHTKNHVVDKQTGQTCVSKQMLQTCQGKPLKIRQRSVEFVCVSSPSSQAQSLEKRALAGEPLSEVRSMPTSFRRVEFEPVMCSSQGSHQGGQW